MSDIQNTLPGGSLKPEGLKAGFAPAIVVVIIGLLSLGIFLYVNWSWRLTLQRCMLLKDNIAQVRMNITEGHLWFEELMGGDETVQIENVWVLLNLANQALDDSIKGDTGQPKDGSFINQKLLNQLDQLKSSVNKLQDITKERWESRDTSGIGSPIDQRFDEVFREALSCTNVANKLVQQYVDRELKTQRWINILILSLWSIIVSGMFTVLFVSEKKRKQLESERNRMEEELRKHRDRLEELVEERTIELKAVNEQLQQEICERKKIEEELYKINDQFKKAQQIAHVGSWDWDIHTDVISWSDEMYRIFGLTPDKFIPRYDEILNCVHPDDRVLVDYSMKEKALKKGKPYCIEHRIIHPDGSVRILKALGEAIWDKNGNPIRMMGIGEDITERRRMEEEREKLYEQLHHARRLESVGKLAGAIAHDFNNILSAIIGYGELLLGKVKEDVMSKGHVQKLLATAERATNLIQGLLMFGRKITDLKPVNLNNVIRKAENILSKLVPENIILKTVFTDRDCVVMADSEQIEQVLMNLTTNAGDAMPDGGFFTISTEIVEMDNEFIKTHGYGKIGRYVCLSFADTGMGMDEKTQEKIFEPFFTTKKFGKGTGLGLSIVYAIVKQHRGYISVYSEPGKGTRFEIYLPIIESVVEEVKPEKLPAPAGGTEVILLAEDDDEVRKLNKTVLEGAGYRVIDAVDGEDAVDKFMKSRDTIQLLLLDVIMPKKDGKEAYDEIKKARQDIKALFMSGYAEDVIDKKRIRKEGLHFISKPVLPTVLLRRVREELDKKLNEKF